ncbi:hypothetical protein [uncultured Pseudoteredinibacter sp.]|uniref:hypothetical protein n=1 Tax=uncultured Pseudoteredinibacter sp. TaxID=1641701 RepID=UPI0026142DF7|nr:hypothetical protein [uncultured Pseudoteredinibacter sp.]
MKVIYVLIIGVLLSACTNSPPQKSTSVESESSQEITITGTRIKKADLPSGPKLKMGLNKENKNSNFMEALATMQTLPQPKDIGDCNGLLNALNGAKLEFVVVNSNKVVLKREHGVYEYAFDDDSCPTNKT